MRVSRRSAALLLDGAIWPASLLVAAPAERIPANRHGERGDEQAGLVVFAAPDDPLAAALAARQGMLRLLPIEAMRDVLTAPSRPGSSMCCCWPPTLPTTTKSRRGTGRIAGRYQYGAACHAAIAAAAALAGVRRLARSRPSCPRR